MFDALRCARVRRRIDDHVDGLLPARDSEEVRDHLDRCTACCEAALLARCASVSMARWTPSEPPADCFDAILRRVDSLPPEALAPRTPPRRTSWTRFALPAGIAAAAVVVVSIVTTQRDEARARAARAEAFAARIQLFPATDAVHVDGLRLDDGVLRRVQTGATRRGVPSAIPVGLDLGVGAPR